MTIKIKEDYQKMGTAYERKQGQICIYRRNLNRSIPKYCCENGKLCLFCKCLGIDIYRDDRDSQEIKNRIYRRRKAVKLLNSI